MRIAPVVAALLVLVIAGATGLGVGPAAAGESVVERCATPSPADYGAPAEENGTLGHVGGYWWDEPLEVNQSDGLDPGELNATVARTAARVEALRCLDFEDRPNVTVRERGAVNDSTDELSNRSAAATTLDGARLETALLAPTTANATQVRRETLGAASQGYYDPDADRIVLLVDDPADPRIDEVVLAHELVHALQHQQFDVPSGARTSDEALAHEALIEGDAGLVEYRYEQRCETGWSEPCLDAGGVHGDGADNTAVQLWLSQPYTDGPAFVDHVERERGWSGVNGLYDSPPTTSYHVVFPKHSGAAQRYAAVEPEAVWPMPPRDDRWERVRPPDDASWDVLGPATVATTLLAPTFENDVENVYGPSTARNTVGGGELDPVRPYDFRLDVVEGWRGDRLYVYEDAAGERGSTWESTWTDGEHADAFQDRYAETLAARGASPVSGHLNTYRFESGDYDGVAYVGQDGEDVIVVHGPDVEAVQSLRPGAAPEAPEGVATSGDAPGGSGEHTDGPETQSDRLGAGVGLVVVAGLVLAITAVVRRRRA